MANYKMIDGVICGDLDQCFERIQQMAAEQGETLEYKFSGHIITSDMSIDDVYSTILGLTKTEYDKEMAEFRAQKEREKLEFEERKPQLAMDYKARGAALVSEDQVADWNETVDCSLDSKTKGLEIKNALELMEAIERGADLDELRGIINSRGCSVIEASLIEKFSKHGDGMYRFIVNNDPSGLDSSVNPHTKQDSSIIPIFCQMVEAERQGADFGELARILWTSYSSDRMIIAKLFDKETDFKYNMKFHADQIMTGDKQVIFNTAIEHNGKDYILATGIFGVDLDSCHQELQNMEKEYGRPICYLFNDSVIYSDMTINEVYQSVIGETKDEYDRHLAEHDVEIESEEFEEEVGFEIGE